MIGKLLRCCVGTVLLCTCFRILGQTSAGKSKDLFSYQGQLRISYRYLWQDPLMQVSQVGSVLPNHFSHLHFNGSLRLGKFSFPLRFQYSFPGMRDSPTGQPRAPFTNLFTRPINTTSLSTQLGPLTLSVGSIHPESEHLLPFGRPLANGLGIKFEKGVFKSELIYGSWGNLNSSAGLRALWKRKGERVFLGRVELKGRRAKRNKLSISVLSNSGNEERRSDTAFYNNLQNYVATLEGGLQIKSWLFGKIGVGGCVESAASTLSATYANIHLVASQQDTVLPPISAGAGIFGEWGIKRKKWEMGMGFDGRSENYQPASAPFLVDDYFDTYLKQRIQIASRVNLMMKAGLRRNNLFLTKTNTQWKKIISINANYSGKSPFRASAVYQNLGSEFVWLNTEYDIAGEIFDPELAFQNINESINVIASYQIRSARSQSLTLSYNQIESKVLSYVSEIRNTLLNRSIQGRHSITSVGKHWTLFNGVALNLFSMDSNTETNLQFNSTVSIKTGGSRTIGISLSNRFSLALDSGLTRMDQNILSYSLRIPLQRKLVLQWSANYRRRSVAAGRQNEMGRSFQSFFSMTYSI